MPGSLCSLAALAMDDGCPVLPGIYDKLACVANGDVAILYA